MIAALFALILQLAHQGPATASPAHGGTVPPPPAVVAPGPASGVSPSSGGHSATILPGGSGTQPGPAPETVPAACAAGEESDGLRCVALQLPEETIGRADW